MPNRAPQNDDVYTWLEIATFGQDPTGAMGFTYNLDTYLQRSPSGSVEVTVNAEWGWPEVPEDVKRAVIWIAGGMDDPDEVDSGGKELTSESIAEVARSWAQDENDKDKGGPIPKAAILILDLYKRWSL
jgi:hypothetical protein